MTLLKRAVQDILKNRLLNGVAIITIALSVLIVSAFALFFLNAKDIMDSWKKGIRIMAYLKEGVPKAKLLDVKYEIQRMYGVKDVRFISKDEAMEWLKEQMKWQPSFLADLKENPLPDAFEIHMMTSPQNGERIESLATQIESLSLVDEVEYGQRWLKQFTGIFDLFRLAGYAIGGLFFMAAVFIVANTIRLILYTRREEIEIMRLIGATDRFIKTPFYIEGLIQGTVGGIIGLAVLFAIYTVISSSVEGEFLYGLHHIRFLPPQVSCGIVICSMFIGWLGCYLSLKQFLKA